MNLLKKLRAIAGFGALWSVLWVLVNLGYLGIIALLTGFSVPGFVLVNMLQSAAFFGFFCGATFGAAMGVFFRKRTLAQLRQWQMALLGGAIGSIPALVTLAGVSMMGGTLPVVVMAVNVLMSAGLGAGIASGTLHAARKAPDALAVPDTDPTPVTGSPDGGALPSRT